MKKQYFFYGILISVILFSSCSKNDDNINSSALIGVWIPIKDVSICSSGSEEVYEYDACEQKGTLEFTKDGNLYYKEYELENNGDCVFFMEVMGTWTLSDDILNYGTVFRNRATIEFNGNILRINDLLEEGESYDCDDESSETTSYSEFIRVKE